MRILAFKRAVPWPLSSGQHLPTYHILSRLAKTHDLLLACWEGEATGLTQLPFESVLRPLPNEADAVGKVDRYLLEHYGMRAASISWLRGLIAEYRPDVLFGIDYQTLIALDGHPDVPSVCYLIDNRWLQNLEQLRREKSHQWYNLKSTLWSYVLHRRYANAADVYVFVTERDAAALRQFTGRTCVGVPNGVDTGHYRPSGAERVDDSVVFVGSLDFPPNVEAVNWFCREVWPIVRTRRPAARLTLVGKRPSREVSAWDGHDGICIAGDVPDVRPYLHTAAVAVAPMRSGGGIKNKILEAWATATPVVATSMSLHGVAAEIDANILVADGGTEFAGQVARLLGDPALRDRIGESGRETAVLYHSWDQTAQHVEECLREARQVVMCTR